MQPTRLTQPLILTRGATFRQTFFLQQTKLAYEAITGGRSFPLEITVPAHGLLDGWPIWIEGLKGIPELNRPYGGAPIFAEVIDEDTLRFGSVSGVDRPRPNGGSIVYNLPVDLTGATISVELLDTAEPDETLIVPSIVGPGEVQLLMSASNSATITWGRAKFALWLTMSNGDRDCWVTGEIVAEGVAP
ncbi:hypothetical protein GOD54_23625 [Sinorhizobium medicae]|nr:hypothetical protein [Sinorhizobium medicae]